jgi:hypothetical protein
MISDQRLHRDKSVKRGMATARKTMPFGMKKSTFEFIGYIVLAGVLIGYYGFRETFVDWFWSIGYIIVGLLGAPVVLGAAIYFLLLFLLFRLAVWFYRNILWG